MNKVANKKGTIKKYTHNLSTLTHILWKHLFCYKVEKKVKISEFFY